jgi:fumarate hydratase class II
MGDPYSYLLSNNIVPSAVEAASIELEVAELKDAICELRTQLQERTRQLQ